MRVIIVVQKEAPRITPSSECTLMKDDKVKLSIIHNTENKQPNSFESTNFTTALLETTVTTWNAPNDWPMKNIGVEKAFI